MIQTLHCRDQIQGDPNQNLQCLFAITLKLCISDPMLESQNVFERCTIFLKNCKQTAENCKLTRVELRMVWRQTQALHTILFHDPLSCIHIGIVDHGSNYFPQLFYCVIAVFKWKIFFFQPLHKFGLTPVFIVLSRNILALKNIRWQVYKQQGIRMIWK